MVSIYDTHRSNAGEGRVVFIDIPEGSGFTGICTENRDLTHDPRPSDPF